MKTHTVTPEVLVLGLLTMTESMDLDTLVKRFPELSWTEVFQAVDRLSRRGYISLRRNGFRYECALLDRWPDMAETCDALVSARHLYTGAKM
jgi:hypothetical protein